MHAPARVELEGQREGSSASVVRSRRQGTGRANGGRAKASRAAGTVAPGLCVVDAGACGFVVVVEVPFLGTRALFKSM